MIDHRRMTVAKYRYELEMGHQVEEVMQLLQCCCEMARTSLGQLGVYEVGMPWLDAM
jgi:hypothetical protein